MKYKGIELEGLDKKVKLSHSRFMETDEGTDWIDKLLTCDKAALTPTQFHEVSALSSVINMDYQICNGGISQYVCNGYHEYRAPYGDDDVAQLDKHEQYTMLCKLADLLACAFGEGGKAARMCTMKTRRSGTREWTTHTMTSARRWRFSARHMPSISASHTESPSRSMKGAPHGVPPFPWHGRIAPACP